MAEKLIEKRLKSKIEALGGRCYKFVSPNNMGMPDRIVVIFGNVFFVEMKAPVGRLSTAQKKQHRNLRKLGVEVYTLYTDDDVDGFIEEVVKV